MSQWHYVDGNGRREGPIEDGALAALWRSGGVGLDTLVWREGESEWRPLQDYRDLLVLLDAGRPLPPPLPPGAGRPQARATASAPGTAPRAGISGCLVALVVAAVLLVPGTAILAAIALPAYQDYTLRATIAAAVSAAAPLQDAVLAHLDQQDQCPTDADVAPVAAAVLAQRHIGRATVGEFESNLCGIELLISGTGKARLDGQALWLEWQPAAGRWQCSSEIDDRYLPGKCRG